MVAERKVIDIEDVPEVETLTRELDEHPEGLILRRGGRQIAEISALSDPIEARGDPGSTWKAMTPADVERFRSAAGAWVGLVDFDELDAQREAHRRASVELDLERQQRIGLEDIGA